MPKPQYEMPATPAYYLELQARRRRVKDSANNAQNQLFDMYEQRVSKYNPAYVIAKAAAESGFKEIAEIDKELARVKELLP